MNRDISSPAAELLSEAEAIEAGAPPLPAVPARIGLGGAYVLAALAASLFSTKAIAVKLAYAEGVDTETLLALRMGVALPFYLAVGVLALRARTQRKEAFPSWSMIARAALIGILGYWFASYMDFLGLVYISAQFERLILFTYPIFVVLFGALFFRQPIDRRVLVTIALSYAGLVLIFTEQHAAQGNTASIGALFVLASAVAFALFQLLAKAEIGRIGPRLFTCISMTAASLAACIPFLLTRPLESLWVGPRLMSYVMFLGIGATVVPTFLMNAALQRISAQANAAIGNFSPVATIVLAVLVLGEALTTIDIIGAALVLAGIGWFTLASSGKTRIAAPRR